MSSSGPRGFRDALHILELDQARWEAVLDTARDAIIGIDTSGIVTLFNRSAQEIFGYAGAEVLGQNVSMLMPAPYRDEHDRYLQNYHETKIRKAIGYVRYVEAMRKSGEVFPIELSVSEARVGEGVLYTAIIRDVTERKRAEAELAEMRKRDEKRERLADIGAITAKIAHDLGNPLSGLSMQAQLILQRARRDGSQPIETILKPAEQLVSEVRRLGDLIREFLSFAREQRLDLAPIELAPFLSEVLDLWRPVAEHQGIRIEEVRERAVERIEADRGKLRRVLDNLVKNAVEAIGTGPGEVRIVTSVAGGEKVRISVEDTGCGIPDNVQIFRLFETTKEDGSGLGLAVSKQILLAHGGDLLFSARSPRGTAFHVELPLRRTTV
jgi:two-component system sensor kinase FixL